MVGYQGLEVMENPGGTASSVGRSESCGACGVGVGVTGNEASEVGGSRVLWVLKVTRRNFDFILGAVGTTGGFSASEGHGAIYL